MQRLFVSFAVALSLTASLGCRAHEAPAGVEATCTVACGEKARGKCSLAECQRGCNLAIDRLREHQGDTVIACVAKAAEATKACEDATWSTCAAKVGTHVDGGPPAPKPPAEDPLDE